jgi:hypothetical protein
MRRREAISGRRGDGEAGFVFEHVRRRIDLDVDGPPQGNPHGGVVGGGGLLLLHEVLSF